MKATQRLSSLLTAAAFLFVAFASPDARAVQASVLQGEAVAVFIEGMVEVSSNGQNWKTLQTKDVLKTGTQIRTSHGAKVDLFLNHNGPVVRLDENSHLELTKLNRQERDSDILIDTQLTLLTGTIYGYTQKVPQGSSYTIEIPDRTVDVTGTQYVVSTSGYVGVISGSVKVRYSKKGYGKLGVAVTVNAGFMFNPNTGGVQPINNAFLTPVHANVTAAVGNTRKFSLSKGQKLEVTTIAPVSP